MLGVFTVCVRDSRQRNLKTVFVLSTPKVIKSHLQVLTRAKVFSSRWRVDSVEEDGNEERSKCRRTFGECLK